MRDTGAQIRPTAALRRSRGKPVVVASVNTGVAIEPKATGAVLASKQIAAAKKGENSKPASIAAATATGVPKPAAPSMNAPNANAMSSACTRRSRDNPPTESFQLSNCPEASGRLNRRIVVKTTQPIGKSPNAAP